jgi:protoporphyrinogen oxidase
MNKKVAIIGAGPAGLTAAYLLSKAGINVTVFEKDATYVGGISRTEQYKGYFFDIGGHRFFSKSKEVEDFWTEILGDELLERPRSSRIYYQKKFFAYPLVAFEALQKLGIIESFLCVLSYIKAKLFPVKNAVSVEDWVSNMFGKRLYHHFFKTYTEKVWGISCKDISADWAAQRIKGLSLSSAIKHAFIKTNNTPKNKTIKTLIDSFRYPKRGPGQMWETCTQKCRAMGATIIMNAAVSKLNYNHTWNITLHNGSEFSNYDFVLSSAAIKDIIPHITPTLPKQAIDAANNLQYRDFITVVLICQDEDSFTDNWIYIHDPKVKVGRIQNFKSWSPYMVPNNNTACYGLEYFCFEGDGMWNMKDQDLIELGKKEMQQIGLIKKEKVLEGYVVRQQKAYPVYDKLYKQHIDIIKKSLAHYYKGLYLIGRNGMHKYNNQDHSMMTAMLAAKNIIANKELFDVWNVNQDAEYIEEGIRSSNEGGRLIPEALS